MRKLLTVLNATLVATLLIGCSKGEESQAGSTDGSTTAAVSTTGGSGGTTAAPGLVGKYKGEVTLSAEDAKDPSAAIAKTMADSMTLELKADGTFAMTMMAMPVEGTYASTGDNVKLTITKMMGMSMDEAKKMSQSQGRAMPAGSDSMDLKIEEGGKRLVAVKKSEKEKGSMAFVKQ